MGLFPSCSISLISLSVYVESTRKNIKALQWVQEHLGHRENHLIPMKEFYILKSETLLMQIILPLAISKRIEGLEDFIVLHNTGDSLSTLILH